MPARCRSLPLPLVGHGPTRRVAFSRAHRDPGLRPRRTLLAHRLDELGHTVAVVDQDPKAFRSLGPEFSGQTVTGVGFDRQTLETAGIARAHAFAAVSSGDNSNILAARVARETFGVEQVVARIYDPRRAEVYQRLGIPTVATVPWTTGQILRRLLPLGAQDEYRDPSGAVVLAEVHLGESWLGQRASRLEDAVRRPRRLHHPVRRGDAPRRARPCCRRATSCTRCSCDEAREHVERIFEHGPEEG